MSERMPMISQPVWDFILGVVVGLLLVSLRKSREERGARLFIGKRISPPIERTFIEHSSDVPVTRHAPRPGTADLRHALHGPRFVFGDDFADIAFRHVQTTAEGPVSFGGCLSASRTLPSRIVPSRIVPVAEIHD